MIKGDSVARFVRVTRKPIAAVMAFVVLSTLPLTVVGCTPRRGSTETTQTHSDHDGVPDHVEAQLGLDPNNWDTDMDGLSDYTELMSEVDAAGSDDGAAKPRVSPASGLVEAAHAAETTPDMDASVSAESTDVVGEASGENGSEITKRPTAADGEHDWIAVLAAVKPKLAAGNTLEPSDPWQRGYSYHLSKDDVKSVHAAISGQWTWASGDVPTVDEYVAAFILQLRDDKTTPAPCVDESDSNVEGKLQPTQSLGGGPLVSPNAAFVAALQPIERGGFFGLNYPAKVHNGLCDLDGDGIPNYFETYGYRVNKEATLPSRAEPWGFKITGNARYVVTSTDGTDADFSGMVDTQEPPLPTYRPATVTGSGFEIVAVADRDYTKKYFKTNPESNNTDGDADRDDQEVLLRPPLAADQAPWNGPAVAGVPAFRMIVTDVQVVPDYENVVFQETPDWLDETENIVCAAAPVIGTLFGIAAKILSQGENSPSVHAVPGEMAVALTPEAAQEADSSGTSLFPVESVFAAETGAATTGPTPSKPASESAPSAMLSSLSAALKDPGVPRMVGQIKSSLRFMFPKRESFDWSTVAVRDKTKPAGTVSLTLSAKNESRVEAIDVQPAYELLLGDHRVGYRSGGAPISLTREKPVATIESGLVALNIDQLKAAMTGGSFSIIPDMKGGHLNKILPTGTGGTLQNTDCGPWDGFRSTVNENCATVVFDAGDGRFAQFQIAAGGNTTVRDAFYECLGRYDSTVSGSKRFRLLSQKPDTAAMNFAPEELGDWAVVFDARISDGVPFYGSGGHVDPADADYSSSLDVPLHNGSIVHFIHKNRMNTTAVFESAQMSYGVSTKASGGLADKSLHVALKNRSECVSNVDVYFTPDRNKAVLDPKYKMVSKDDGVYALDLPSYRWTGKEGVVGALRGFDATVTTDPFKVAAPLAPNVLVAFGSETYTPEIRSSDTPARYTSKRIGYFLGSVEPTTKVVTWGPEIKISDEGFNPVVALSPNGTAVMLYDENKSGAGVGNQGMCRVGTLRWTREPGKPLAWSMDWGAPASFESGTLDEAAVDMDGAGTVVEMHKDSGTTIWSRVGKEDPLAQAVVWGSPVKVDSGRSPSVGLVSPGTLRQLHLGTDRATPTIYQGAGVAAVGAASTSSVTWGGSTEYGGLGYRPALSLNAGGTLWCVNSQKNDDRQLRYRSGRWNQGTAAFAWDTGDIAFTKETMSHAGSISTSLTDSGTAFLVFNTERDFGKRDGWYRVGQIAHDGSSVTFPGGLGGTSLPGTSVDYDCVSVDCVDGYR